MKERDLSRRVKEKKKEAREKGSKKREGKALKVKWQWPRWRWWCFVLEGREGEVERDSCSNGQPNLPYENPLINAAKTRFMKRVWPGAVC